MRTRIVATSLLLALLGGGLLWHGFSERPVIEEARAGAGFAARCNFHRGQPEECGWRGRIRPLEQDCRADAFGHENANPGHRCSIEPAE